MVHPGGRPRTISLQPQEMIALGEEMVSWVKQNSPLHLNQWYSCEKMFLYKEWKALIQIPEFLPYYERALNIISMNYLDGTINPSTAQRWQRVYFKDLKEEEDETAAYNSKLRSQEGNQTIDENAKILSNAVIDQITKSQERFNQLSSSKMEEITNRTDIKS